MSKSNIIVRAQVLADTEIEEAKRGGHGGRHVSLAARFAVLFVELGMKIADRISGVEDRLSEIRDRMNP
jgi:hypothetical protein